VIISIKYVPSNGIEISCSQGVSVETLTNNIHSRKKVVILLGGILARNVDPLTP
jgi:hypothetical protein